MLRRQSTNKLTSLLLLASCLLFVKNIESKGYRSYSTRAYTRGYTKKTHYAGFGKQSKVNGLIKTKPISGHGKRTSKGYTHVNSYSRSK